MIKSGKNKKINEILYLLLQASKNLDACGLSRYSTMALKIAEKIKKNKDVNNATSITNKSRDMLDTNQGNNFIGSLSPITNYQYKVIDNEIDVDENDRQNFKPNEIPTVGLKNDVSGGGGAGIVDNGGGFINI